MTCLHWATSTAKQHFICVVPLCSYNDRAKSHTKQSLKSSIQFFLCPKWASFVVPHSVSSLRETSWYPKDSKTGLCVQAPSTALKESILSIMWWSWMTLDKDPSKTGTRDGFVSSCMFLPSRYRFSTRSGEQWWWWCRGNDSCMMIIPTSQQHLQPPHWISAELSHTSRLRPTSAPKLQDKMSGDDHDVWERCWYSRRVAGLCVQALCLLPSRLLHLTSQQASSKTTLSSTSLIKLYSDSIFNIY